MLARYEDGAEFRWLNKKVLDSRVLDSMEGLSTWSFTGAGEMALTDVRVKDGQHSLRIRSTTNVAQVDGSGEWDDLVATRKFPRRRLEPLQPHLALGLPRYHWCARYFLLPHAAQ